jgi:hypothetical protein
LLGEQLEGTPEELDHPGGEAVSFELERRMTEGPRRPGVVDDGAPDEGGQHAGPSATSMSPTVVAA